MKTEKKTKKIETVTHHRDAGTGLYITKEYADKHPKTTVKETDKKYEKPQITTHHRDAETGLYITKEYADKHPKTTLKETDITRK